MAPLSAVGGGRERSGRPSAHAARLRAALDPQERNSASNTISARPINVEDAGSREPEEVKHVPFSSIDVGEHAANWWIPEHPQHKTTGKYIVNDDGTTIVEMYENLQEKIATTGPSGTKTYSFGGPAEYAVLLGAVNGKLVSAFAARLIGLQDEQFNDVRVERRQPRYTIESPFYTFHETPVPIQKIRFRPECLTRLSGWKQEPDGRSERRPDGSISYALQLETKPSQIVQWDGAQLTLNQHHRKVTDGQTDMVSVSKYGEILLELAEPIPASDVSRTYIKPLMLMFTLMSSRPEGAATFEFSRDDCPWPDDDLPEGAQGQELWMTVRAHMSRSSTGAFQTSDPLLMMDVMPWDKAVLTWLDWAKLAAAETQLMSLLVDAEFPWLEAKFITCAQMVEGLHRKSFPVTKSAIDENALFITEVIDTLCSAGNFNAKKRGAVKSALKYGYEPSLEDRILALNEAAGNVIGKLTSDNVRHVARACAILRNAFAHSTEKRPVSNLNSVRVAHAALSLIGFSFLLTRVGLEPEAAAMRMISWEGSRAWASLLAGHWQVLETLSNEGYS